MPSQIDTTEFGESALEGALPWDHQSGVPFRSEAKAQQPNIVLLANGRRADKDPDYRWLVPTSPPTMRRKQTSLSLNLQQRKAERERIDKEDDSRAERAARRGNAAAKTSEELRMPNFRTPVRPGRRGHERHGHGAPPRPFGPYEDRRSESKTPDSQLAGL